MEWKHIPRLGESPGHMARLSGRWFSSFSDDWYDLTTTRAFLGGLLGTFVRMICFLLLLVLAILWGLLPPGTIASDPPPGFLLGFLVVMGIAVLTGGGSPYRYHTSTRFRELSTQSWFRVPFVLGLYGFYWLLLCSLPFMLSCLHSPIVLPERSCTSGSTFHPDYEIYHRWSVMDSLLQKQERVTLQSS